MTNIKDLLAAAHRALSEQKIEHALIGGLALGGLGVHRATLDVDFLIDGSRHDEARRALELAGFALQNQTSEVMHFGGIGPVDLLLANRPMSREMLQRAPVLPALEIKCVTVEDLIGLKIQAYSNNPKRAWQDKADIAALIGKHPQLDWDRVKQFAELFGEWSSIEEIRRGI